MSRSINAPAPVFALPRSVDEIRSRHEACAADPRFPNLPDESDGDVIASAHIRQVNKDRGDLLTHIAELERANLPAQADAKDARIAQLERRLVRFDKDCQEEIERADAAVAQLDALKASPTPSPARVVEVLREARDAVAHSTQCSSVVTSTCDCVSSGLMQRIDAALFGAPEGSGRHTHETSSETMACDERELGVVRQPNTPTKGVCDCRIYEQCAICTPTPTDKETR